MNIAAFSCVPFFSPFLPPLCIVVRLYIYKCICPFFSDAFIPRKYFSQRPTQHTHIYTHIYTHHIIFSVVRIARTSIDYHGKSTPQQWFQHSNEYNIFTIIEKPANRIWLMTTTKSTELTQSSMKADEQHTKEHITSNIMFSFVVSFWRRSIGCAFFFCLHRLNLYVIVCQLIFSKTMICFLEL